VKGIKIPLYTVKLARERVVTFPAAVFEDISAAAEFFFRLIGSADREHIAVLFLDEACVPTGASIVGIGTVATVKVHAREIFKAAILASADSMIIAHNHVDAPFPSPDDLRATRSLVYASKQIGIRIRDHLIISPSGACVSMQDLGMLEEEKEAGGNSNNPPGIDRQFPRNRFPA